MQFAVPESSLAALEAAVGSAQDAQRPQRQLEWAWHLRQRDSRRAAQELAAATAALDARPSAWTLALRGRALLLAAELDVLACRHAQAEARLLELRALVGPDGERELVADGFFLEALLAKSGAQSRRELLALERAQACLAAGGDNQRLGIAAGLLACEAAVTAVQEPGQPAAAAWQHGADSACLALQHFAQGMRWWSREPAQAIALLEQAAREALDSGQLRLACIATMNAGNLHHVLRDYDRALLLLGQAAEQAARAGWPLLIGITRAQVGGLLRQLQRPAESRELLTDALRHLRIAPPGPAHANACIELARTLLESERPHEALDLAAESVHIWRARSARLNLAPALMLQARAAVRVGQLVQARALLDEAGAIVADERHAAMAPELHETWSLLHARAGEGPPADAALLALALQQGRLALQAGERLQGWRAAPQLLRHLADLATRCHELEAAVQYLWRADAAQQEGDLLKLRNPELLLQLLSHQAWPAGATAEPTGPRSDSGDLTPREYEILQLLGGGHSNKRIATSLGLGEQTVKWHLKAVYAKLGVGTRQQAVLRARAQGLLQA